jgi:hypothetical protein
LESWRVGELESWRVEKFSSFIIHNSSFDFQEVAMPIKQKLFALAVSLIVLFFTVELVRKKRLREEYSVLWICTSLIMFVLVLKYDWLVALTTLIGAGLPTSTLFIGSIIFLILIAVQFSIKISLLSDQVKNLVQENALLRHEFARLQGEEDEL